MRVIGLILAWLLSLAAHAAELRLQETRDGSALGKAPITVPPQSYSLFFFDLRSNVSELRAVTSGTTADVDLFLKRGVPQRGNSLAALTQESQFNAATSSGNETLIAARTQGLSAGRWWLAVVNLGSAAQTFDLTVNAATSGAPYALTPGQSGTWFEPAKNFQGYFLQAISPTNVLVVWFTYAPNGEQAFFTGVGAIEGDRINIAQLSKTRGARFGGAFNASDVVRENWGTLTITHESCTVGFASYTPSDAAANSGWPFEQLNVQRLSGITGLSCPGGSATGSDKHLSSGASGSWFVPARDGEGWMVETIAPTLAIVYAFTYTPDGRQAWYGGVGTLENGNITVSEATQPTGGRFGPDYNPSQVTVNPWGSFGLTFTGCGTAVADASGPAAYGYFQYPGIVRLTGVAGTPGCATSASPRAISGALVAASQTYLDGDVNDPNVPNRDNDAVAQAQAIGNPATVSGYVTKTATARSGDRFASATDALDVYRLTITAGQSVRLTISDWDAASAATRDLDLYVFAAGAGGNPLASSVGTGRTEQINVNAPGNYDVVVESFAGASNYVLTIGNLGSQAASVSALSLDDLSGERIVVRFDEPAPEDDGAAVLKQAGRSLKARAQALGLEAIVGEPGRPMAFRAPAAETKAWLKNARQPQAPAFVRAGFKLSDEQKVAWQRAVLLKALNARDDVRYAEPDRLHSTQAIPNDEFYRAQWHYPQINLPQAWDITTGSNSVLVAVVDSGVAPHPDLEANVRRDLGRDLISDLTLACDGDLTDNNADDDGYRCRGQTREQSFHGTHVAGTVAARSNNGIGVAGVAWNVQIMPVRALGGPTPEQGFPTDIADAIRWAAGLPVRGAQAARGADVINLSLGGDGPCPAIYQEAINQATQRGAIVVVATGNANLPVGVPANCANVISVGASDRNGIPTAYSNSGPELDLTAPGGQPFADADAAALFAPINPRAVKPPVPGRVMSIVDSVASTVFTSAPNSGVREANYKFLHGTSMATPHVAGVAALMRSLLPSLTTAQLDGLIAAGRITNDDPLRPGRDIFAGYGVVDALKAVTEARALAGGGAPPASLVLSASEVNFGDATTTLPLTASATGSGIAIASVASSQPWLTVAGSGLGTYQLTATRGALPTGDYQGTLTFTPNAGSPLRVTARMRVGPRTTTGDNGFAYALLIDAYTLVPLAQINLAGNQGQYPFGFAGLLPGQYLIIAGSDHDNDDFICDGGETCAVYPSFSNFGPIVLGNVDLNLGGFALEPDSGGLGSAAVSGLGAAVARAYQRIDRHGE